MKYITQIYLILLLIFLTVSCFSDQPSNNVSEITGDKNHTALTGNLSQGDAKVPLFYPTILKITPSQSYPVKNCRFDITGTNFDMDGMKIVLISNSQGPIITATNIEVKNSSFINGIFNLENTYPGDYGIFIQNKNNGTIIHLNAFRIFDSTPDFLNNSANSHSSNITVEFQTNQSVAIEKDNTTSVFIENNQASSPPLEWQKNLGGSMADTESKGLQTSDGGYIVAGFTNSKDGDVSGNHGNEDFWVVKLSIIGNIQWQKCLGGSWEERARSIQQTTDGGYILTGETNSTDGDVSGNHGNGDYWVVKLSSTGALQWQKCFGGTNGEMSSSIQQTTDGGYIVVGSSSSTNGDVSGNHGYGDNWVVKLSSTGTLQWQKCLGGTGFDFARSVQQTTDGGYIIAGDSDSTDGDVSGNHGNYDYWVVKLSSTGALQWQKSLGGSESDWANCAYQTLDGGYIVAGGTYSTNGDVSGNHGSSDSWIVKLTSTGALQWQKCLGGTNDEWATKIYQGREGDFFVSGGTYSTDGDVSGNHGSSDSWIVKLSSTGGLQWQKCLGGSKNDWAMNLQQTDDNGNIVTGSSFSTDGDLTGNKGNNDYWVVKLKSDTEGILLSPGTLSSPGPNLPTLTPKFIWKKISGADSYGLYIRDLSSNKIIFDSRTRGITIKDPSYQLPTGILENGKQYRWNVNAHSTGGWGSYSERFYFQGPTSSSLLPPPELVGPGKPDSPPFDPVPLKPTFTWKEVPGADQYGLYISDITNGESSPDIIFDSQKRGILIKGNSYPFNLDILKNGKKYRWNMNSHNSAGWGKPNEGRFYFNSPQVDPKILPVAKFSVSPEPYYTYDDVKFDASASNNPDKEKIILYVWTIDGEVKSESSVPTYNYKFTVPGKHSISLVVQDISGHVSNPEIKEISVNTREKKGLELTLTGPDKLSNEESGKYEIKIYNPRKWGEGIIPDADNIYVKLEVPTDVYISETNKFRPQIYHYNTDTHITHWYISQLNSNDEYIIEFTAKRDSGRFSLETSPMEFVVTVREGINEIDNAFYPGIGWHLTNPDYETDKRSRETYAADFDALFLHTYEGTYDLTKEVDGGWGAPKLLDNIDAEGALHVYLAYNNIFTDKNFVNRNEDQQNQAYDIIFCHSGGTQTVLKKLELGKIKAKFVFFIAPALIDMEKLQKIINEEKVDKIFVVQSTEDALYKTKIAYNNNYFRDPAFWDTFPAISPLHAPISWNDINLEWDGKFFWYNCENLIPDNVDISNIEDEEFWIGGCKRDEQRLFIPYIDKHFEQRIYPINPDKNDLIPNSDAEKVHQGLINWVVDKYNTNSYPFDGTISDSRGETKLTGRSLPKSQITTKIVCRSSAHDPNEKRGPEGHHPADKALNYTVEYENMGDGTAFDVNFTDILDPSLDESTLEISPVFSVMTGQEISERGIYFLNNRTIRWDVGEVGPGEGGYANISIKFSSLVPDGTKVVNDATVYFPSAYEETQTNAVVTVKGVNHPPGIPNLKYPVNNSQNLWRNGSLQWNCTEPDNETLLYDVYLGKSPNLEKVILNSSSSCFEFSNLTFGSTYGWKVVAKDPYDGVTSSDVHLFTTISPGTLPDVDFYANKTTGSIPLSVKFYDNSRFIDEQSSWFWDFGDGTNSTDYFPIHEFKKVGHYSVNLTVSNFAGVNQSTKKNYILTIPPPPRIITATCSSNGTITPSGPVSVPYDTSMTFTITPDFGYSIEKVLVDNTNVGTVSKYTFHNVTEDHVISANFTIDPTTKPLISGITPISGIPGTSFSFTLTGEHFKPDAKVTLTYPEQVSINATGVTIISPLRIDGQFSIPSTAQYGNWNLAVQQGTDDSLPYPFVIHPAGVYIVDARSDGLGWLDPSGILQVNKSSNLKFSFKPTAGAVVKNLMVNGAEVSYTPNLTYSIDNINQDYLIRLNNEPLPGVVIAGFSVSPVEGNSVQFTDASWGDPVLWRWDFGDGTSGSGNSIVHTYANSGTYAVSLWARSALSQSQVVKGDVSIPMDGKTGSSQFFGPYF